MPGRTRWALYDPVAQAFYVNICRSRPQPVCDFRKAMISFRIEGCAGYPFRMTMDFYDKNNILDQDHNDLGLPRHAAINRWNNGKYLTNVGVYENLPIFNASTLLMDNGFSTLVPVRISGGGECALDSVIARA